MVLVRGDRNYLYVCVIPSGKAAGLISGSVFDIGDGSLELAVEKHIRAVMNKAQNEVLKTSHLVSALFVGVVSGGCSTKSVLVGVDGVMKVARMDAAEVKNVCRGDVVMVDRRYLAAARQDQIDAGTGVGTLKRRKRGC
jgi:hypothetical protein